MTPRRVALLLMALVTSALADADPHGDSMEEMFQAPQDSVDDDANLPSGTIVVELRDENDKPLPNAALTLGILKQSVAKGEGRERRPAITSESGQAKFSDLVVGSEVAYRISSTRDGASYGARPFNLPLDRGMRVVLHAYPATNDVQTARVVMEGVVYFDLKDDRVQVQQLFTVMNFGRVTWVPKDLVLPLPADFTALRSQEQMSDIGVDAVPKQGAKIRGSFVPGRSEIQFSWQVPYHGSERVDVTAGMPPHLAVLRVMAVAAPQMKLEVDGFPAAQSGTDMQGQRVLTTQREATREDPAMAVARVHLTNIPTQGPAPYLVTALAGLGVAIGLALGSRRGFKTKLDPKKERANILSELEELERARAEGAVGPKTYEQARRALIDALARTLQGQPSA